MKLYENIKNNNIRTVRLLGIPLYSTEDTPKYRTQHFFGNFIYTKKLKSNIKEIKILKVLNFVVSKRTIINDIIRYYMFGHLIKIIPLIEQFYNDYIKKLKIDYDDVYILNANSGETYLFFAYLVKATLNKNKTMKPLFVVTKKYHIDILNLYLPNSKYIFIKNLQFKTQKDKFEFCNHNFYMIFTVNHFKDVEIAVKQEEIGHVHYLKSIIMRLGLSESDCVIPSPILPVNVEKNLTKKINKTHLNLNNFIIIAPEALTCEELPKSFWKQLAIDLKSRGYEIFVNITNKKNFIQGCKTCTISYSELYLLCEKAKAIISLRSGLSEFVLPTGIPNISIYTKFRKRKPELAFPVEKGIVGFSMIKIPFVNQEKIVELNAEKYATIDELKEITIKSFENTLNRKECLV